MHDDYVGMADRLLSDPRAERALVRENECPICHWKGDDQLQVEGHMERVHKKKVAAVGLACQIVFEYPDWGDEHVSDMLQTYEHTGEEQPCDYDELMDLCVKAQRMKDAGSSFEETEKALLEPSGTKKKKGES